jgi:predicted nucleotidyltransferase
MTQVPDEVAEVVGALQEGLGRALGGELVGLYLRGSVAMGDFDPVTSDVDFLTVVETTVSAAMFGELRAVHSGLAELPNRYAHHLEGAYIDRKSVRRFEAGERKHPEILAGKELEWAELRDNWVLERWVVRERGIVLSGPDPATVIEPITVEDLRRAATSELARRVVHWAAQDSEIPGWLRARFMQAFEVETVCRALYTVRFGELCSKPVAVSWALGALPERWRQLVERSQGLRADHTEDATGVRDVKGFARWAAGKGAEWVRPE